jgi:hypothetical protein
MADNEITKVAQDAKLVQKPSLIETLRNLEMGLPSRINSKDFKTTTVRTIAGKIKPEGYEFLITEVGMTDCCIVTKTKNPDSNGQATNN